MKLHALLTAIVVTLVITGGSAKAQCMPGATVSITDPDGTETWTVGANQTINAILDYDECEIPDSVKVTITHSQDPDQEYYSNMLCRKPGDA